MISGPSGGREVQVSVQPTTDRAKKVGAKILNQLESPATPLKV